MNLIELTELYNEKIAAFGLYGKIIRKGATLCIHFPCGNKAFNVSFRSMDNDLIMTVSSEGKLRNFCITDVEINDVVFYIKKAASELC